MAVKEFTLTREQTIALIKAGLTAEMAFDCIGLAEHLQTGYHPDSWVYFIPGKTIKAMLEELGDDYPVLDEELNEGYFAQPTTDKRIAFLTSTYYNDGCGYETYDGRPYAYVTLDDCFHFYKW